MARARNEGGRWARKASNWWYQTPEAEELIRQMEAEQKEKETPPPTPLTLTERVSK